MSTRLPSRRLPTLMILAAFATAPALAQPAYMVADLGTTSLFGYSLWEGPLSEYLTVGGKLYFFADDGVHGRELWRSDGTALGTFLVRDLCPGSCGSRYPNWSSMAGLGDDLLFVADDGVHGLELWLTDGSALGTRMVADIRPGYDSSFLETLTSAGDQAFFVARRDNLHASLWRTDGTAKGTYAIAPPGPPAYFAPTSIHVGPGFLYLCNASWGGQDGLWKSDGSAEGTTFIAPVECWQNSIGKRGTMLVDPSGVLYFQGSSPASSDEELWRSDGTPSGTWRVKDILPGVNGSWPSGLVWFEGGLLFQTSGEGLWISDGTEAGTVPVALADGAQPRPFWGEWTVAGGKYYFAAEDPAHGVEPWVFDGSTASMVVDLVPGPGSSIITDFPNASLPVFATFGSEAIFSADDGTNGLEMWRTDGSAGGTVRISDIVPGAGGLRMPVFGTLHEASLGGRPMIFEHQPAFGERLWRLDPAGDGMQLVDVLNGQTPLFERRGTDRFSLFEPERGSDCFEGSGGYLFFERRLNDPAAIDLFRTDGALDGPEEIFHGLPPREGACGHHLDRLLYVRKTGPQEVDAELLGIDAASGASEVLLPTGVSLRSWPPFLDRAGAQVFGTTFSLYTTVGTAAGTSLLATEMEEFGGHIDLFLGEIVQAGNALRITDAAEPTGARVLFQGDGITTYPELDLAPLGSTLVFVAHDPAHGSELWISNGTPEGTALLVDSNPGPASAFRGVSVDRYWELRDPRLLGGGTYAVFAGLNALAGEELWVTDGTALGTIESPSLQLTSVQAA